MKINRGMLASTSKYMGMSEILNSSMYLTSAILQRTGNSIQSGAGKYLKGGTRNMIRGWGRGMSKFGGSMLPSSSIGPSVKDAMRLSRSSFRDFLGVRRDWSMRKSMGMTQRAARMGMLGGAALGTGYVGYRATFGRSRRR